MNEIIITTPEQLRTLIETAVRSSIHAQQAGQTKQAAAIRCRRIKPPLPAETNAAVLPSRAVL